jgi:hypothetical protein
LTHLVVVRAEATSQLDQETDAQDGYEEPEREEDAELRSRRIRVVACLDSLWAEAPPGAAVEKIDEDEDGDQGDADRGSREQEYPETDQEDCHDLKR